MPHGDDSGGPGGAIPLAAASIRFVPIEHQWTRISIPPVRGEAGAAVRREQELVHAYRNHLVGKKHAVGRLEIRLLDGTVLRSDIVDGKRLALIEAKGQASREAVRMALGQLADYKRFMNPSAQYQGLLVPERPSADLVNLIGSAGAIAIWPTAEGFEDSAGGALC